MKNVIKHFLSVFTITTILFIPIQSSATETLTVEGFGLDDNSKKIKWRWSS